MSVRNLFNVFTNCFQYIFSSLAAACAQTPAHTYANSNILFSSISNTHSVAGTRRTDCCLLFSAFALHKLLCQIHVSSYPARTSSQSEYTFNRFLFMPWQKFTFFLTHSLILVDQLAITLTLNILNSKVRVFFTHWATSTAASSPNT